MDVLTENRTWIATCCTASAERQASRCKQRSNFVAHVSACTRCMTSMQTLDASGAYGKRKQWITAGHTAQARTLPATAKWLDILVSRTPTKTGMSAKGNIAAAGSVKSLCVDLLIVVLNKE